MDFNLSVALSLSDWAIALNLTQFLDVQVRVAHRTPCGGVVIYYSDDNFTQPHDVWPGDLDGARWRPVEPTELEAKFSKKAVPA